MVAVIPAYEPNQMLIQLVQQLKKLKFSVLLIDDGSSIEKQSIFDRLQKMAVVLHHSKNYGKGNKKYSFPGRA